MKKAYIISIFTMFLIVSMALGQATKFTPIAPYATILDQPGRTVYSRPYDFTEIDTVVFNLSESGYPSSHIDYLSSGDVEAIKYTTEHPCSLYELGFYLQGSGTIEAHIWEDWSGLPNLEGDLCPYMFLTTYGGSGWRTIDIETELGHKVYIPPKTDFQIGRKIYGGEPYLKYADNHVPLCSHLYISSEDTWYYIGDSEGAFPYMVYALGVYFDIDTVRQFHDIAEDAGISSGRTVAWGDYNNDGYDDFIATGVLYKNNKNGTFTNTGISFGGKSSWGDFNGDGQLDVVTIAYPLRLWRNDGWDSFTNVADEMGFVDYDEPKNCAAFGDINGDGWLDLYVSYSENWNDGDPIYYSDHLYINMAGTLFVEVTDSLAPAITEDRYSRGVHYCDFDMDGDQDIYVSCYRLLKNFFLINDGEGNLADSASEYGVAGHPDLSGTTYWYGHTIGSVWCDFDNDGDFDIIAANLAHPRFIDFSDKTYVYRNNGDGTFTNIYDSSGIAYYETHSSPAIGDYDNDGNLDFYISCVYEGYHSWIYKGNGDGTFTCDNYLSGVWTDNGWGCGWSDFDNDGDLDLLTSGNSGLELYRNDGCPHENSWVKLRLWCDINVNNYYAYGAQARLYLDDGRILSRCIQGNTGTEGCMDSRTMHFGAGSAIIADSLTILWPGGGRTVYNDFNIDCTTYDIYESGTIDTTYIVSGNSLPSAMKISACPNPFNSSVTIAVDCHSRENGNPEGVVSVEIFDISGRRVAQLPVGEGFKPSRSLTAEPTGGPETTPLRNGEFVWQPSPTLGSGVYLVRARFDNRSLSGAETSDSGTITKRIVYLK